MKTHTILDETAYPVSTTYKKLLTCLCCNSDKLTLAIDLNTQPLANSYVSSLEEYESVYPLALNYCNSCSHLQLSHAVDPNLLFKNYIYVSGTTKTLRDYFDSFVEIVSKYYSNQTSPLTVLDIACNDGSQLDSFKKLGHHTYGIDPAENLYASSSKNHFIICDYLTPNSISKFDTKFDTIIAQNVLAHNSYPLEFLKICKTNIKDTGRIFIQTSQAEMIKYGQFDTIYHEHISFFNAHSFSTLANNAGLYVIDIIKTDIHGTSYVFVLSTNQDEDNSAMLLQNEGFQTAADLSIFAESAINTITKLKSDIQIYKDLGYLIVGYGAAAKGNTVLNFGNIDLDYIVDDNPLKQNLFTPGRKIKIVSFDAINSISPNTPVVWLPLSWNFFKEIKFNIETKRPTLSDMFIQLSFVPQT